MPDGPSEEASSAIWWFLHGLIVVVIVLAIVCADRGTRLQFHALLFRLRAWMGRQRAGVGGAYATAPVSDKGRTRPLTLTRIRS